MSHKHNLSLAALLGLGVIVIAVLGASVMKEARKSSGNKNPYQDLTRPQFYPESPSEGEDSASLALFEYGDFACPSCREMQRVVERIFAAYGDRVYHVWKDFPLHPVVSEKAAVAARCADKQGKFWPYHDLLFSKQVELGEIDLTKAGQALGLDTDKFNSCLEDQDVAELVERDFLEGQALGVAETPTFVIGDQAFSGVVSFEDFESIVLAELAKIAR